MKALYITKNCLYKIRAGAHQNLQSDGCTAKTEIYLFIHTSWSESKMYEWLSFVANSVPIEDWSDFWDVQVDLFAWWTYNFVRFLCPNWHEKPCSGS